MFISAQLERETLGGGISSDSSNILKSIKLFKMYYRRKNG